MSRIRSTIAAPCLAAFLLAALPTPGAALRDAVQISATVAAEPMGEGLAGSFFAWGSSAFSWIRALIAAEHGVIVPFAPPPPPPTPPADPEPDA